eukprot:230966_1
MAHTTIDTSRDKNEFDEWLEKHNLIHVKHIFIEHNMDKLSDLSLQNKNLGGLLADERFYNKPNIVTTVFAAIQSLDKQKQQLSSKNVYIIASHKENEIMKQLQKQVDELKQLQNESKQIHDAYNNKVNSNNNTLKQYKTKCSAELTVITNHVMKYMNQLKELVKHKQSCLYKEINVHQTKLTQRKSKHMKAVNKIDSAIDETLNKYSTTINKAIQHYKSKIVECENIMKTCSQDDIFSHNPQREKKIIHIAENAQKHFTDTKEKILDYKKSIKQIYLKKSKIKLHMILNSLESSHEDEKKSYEDTNFIYPYVNVIHINQSLYKEIKNDINTLISITVHSKYENKNIEQQIASKLPVVLNKQLQFEKNKKHQLQLQLTKLYDMNKSDKKLIEKQQKKRNDLYKKVKKYQPHFEEKKNDESKTNSKNVNNQPHKPKQYVPLRGNKRNIQIGRQFDIFYESRLWDVSADKTSIKSWYDHDPNWKIKSQPQQVKGSIIYPVHRNKNGYNTGIHTWSVQQRNATGNRIIGITTKRSYNNVQFECCLDGYKELSWKSGEIIHIILDCDNSVVTFYKSKGIGGYKERMELEDFAFNQKLVGIRKEIKSKKYGIKKVKKQKISGKKSYYFVLVANAFNSTGSIEYFSVPTIKYKHIKKMKSKRRHSIHEKKKRKSKIKHFLSLNKQCLSDGDAEEMKYEYERIRDDGSDVSILATVSLSPKSVKSDGSTKARNKRNIKSLKPQRSSNRSKSKGAKQFANHVSENGWVFGPK